MDKNYRLLSLPGNQEIVAGAILIVSPTRGIMVFKDLKDYLNYLADLENHDDT